MILTYRFRLKDKHDADLSRQARSVNWVWNFCRETQENALRWGKRWPSAYDLHKLTAGCARDLGLHAHTVQRVCLRYTASRNEQKKPLLRWRGKHSLGWVPFNSGHVLFDGECFVFNGVKYSAWVTRDIASGARFLAGSFSQDAQGHWFINLPCQVVTAPSRGTFAIGIDLGLKDIAALSTGQVIANPRWYRNTQARIGAAQRAGKKRQAASLHAKVAAQRADYLHKESTRLTREHAAIFVGNVKPKAIAQTRLGKSSLDAGWAMFKQQLEYKAIARGVLFAEVREAYTTQTCSRCGSIEGPRGVAGLGIREWTCSCGARLNRDTNAAENILRRGLATLVEGAAATAEKPTRRVIGAIEGESAK